METEHPTVRDVCYSTYKYQVLVEKWWSSGSGWHVNVIVKDMKPAMDICLETENVSQLIEALHLARDKADAMKAELREEAQRLAPTAPTTAED